MSGRRLGGQAMRWLVCLAVAGCLYGAPDDVPKPGMPLVDRPPLAPPPPVQAVPPPAAADDLSALDPAAQRERLMTLGRSVYEAGGSGGVACQTCHGPAGEGQPPSFPPLRGQVARMGDCVRHAGMVVHGLKGPLEIDGVRYDGVMPAQPGLSDLEIAAVITFERQSWGHDAGLCLPADVAAARSAPPPSP